MLVSRPYTERFVHCIQGHQIIFVRRIRFKHWLNDSSFQQYSACRNGLVLRYFGLEKSALLPVSLFNET